MGVFKDMKELELKYGCNPNQRPARIFMREGELPITVLNGKPGYINFLGRAERVAACKRAAPGHGPARGRVLQARQPRRRGAGPPLDDTLKKMYFVEDIELSPLACAYAAPAARTACPASGTGSPFPTNATKPRRRSSSTRCRTALSRRAIPRRAGHPENKAQGRFTTLSPSTHPTSPRPWSTRMCSASRLSRGATS